MSTTPAEMQTLKDRLKVTWMAGDYGHFATYMEGSALGFLRSLDVQPGTRMLDVACGAGQIAIPAARAGADVTGIDIAANSIEQARARAAAEGLTARFDVGDAEELPYAAASFDLVTSLIGAMFAPRPERVAAELLRVCRPGGRIAMGNWTANGFIGEFFRTIGGYVAPSPLMAPPVKWGDADTVRERMGAGASRIDFATRHYVFRYPFPPAEVVDFFGAYYGPTVRAFATLDDEGRRALHRDLTDVWSRHNRATDGTTHVEAEYLSVIAHRD